MPAVSIGDYSKHPEPLRDVLPYLEGEVCDLHSSYAVFRHLFMENEARTVEFGKRLGGLLGTYQALLQDDMIVGISRLMDRDNRQQKNLTFWSLLERCRRWDAAVATDVAGLLDILDKHVTEIRTHRHKRLAHFDLPTSLGQKKLPTVTFIRIKECVGQMEDILNLVSQRAVDTTIMFDVLDHRDIVGTAAVTIYKAMAYDQAEKEGKIDVLAWKNHVHRE